MPDVTKVPKVSSGQNVYRKRALLLRYEDLFRDPPRVVGDLDFLKLPPTSRMLEYPLNYFTYNGIEEEERAVEVEKSDLGMCGSQHHR